METQYITPEEFKDIAPIDDCDFKQRMAQLVKESGFEHAIKYVMPDVDYPKFVAELCEINSKEEFQQKTVAPFLEMLAFKTTTGLSISGVENVYKNKNYTYITNHRDIVLDASFLNMLLVKNGINTTEIAIGNNLLVYEWISDLVKLNKSFIVKRNLRMIKALEAAKQLSGYINYAINEKHESVWIAQREGRCKDSNDKTQESLIKMLGLAGGSSLLENVKNLNLLPVAISYEYDPNDYLKAREFLMKRNDPEYKKSQRDDLFSMETGLLQFKGHVHFTIGQPINPTLDNLSCGADKAEVVKYICKTIDETIYKGYRIYPINYIALDLLENTQRFQDKYTLDEVVAFEKYITTQLAKVEDVPNLSDDDMQYMRQMMLTMYANPLKNQLATI
jgi:hypothetical protein